MNRERFPGLADGWARLDGPGGTQMVDAAIDAMADWMRSGRTANEGGAFPHARRQRGDRRGGAGERRAAARRRPARRRVRAEHDGADDALLGRRRARARARRRDRLHAARPRRQRAPVADRRRARRRARALRRARAGHARAARRRRSRPCSPSAPAGSPSPPPPTRSARCPTCPGSSPRRGASGARVYVDAVHAAPAPAARRRRARLSTRSPARPTSGSGRTSACCARAPELLEELTPDKLRPSPDAAPDRWELGTLPFEALAGVRAAADYVALARLGRRCARTRTRCWPRRWTGSARIERRDALRRRARPHADADVQRRRATTAREVAAALAEREIAVWNGNYYAWELERHLGLAPRRRRPRRASCTTTTPGDARAAGRGRARDLRRGQ